MVVALEGGTADREAVCWGAAQALTTGRPLHLVHVLEDVAIAVADVSGTVLMAPGDVIARSRAAAREGARSLVAVLAPDAGVSVVEGHVLSQLVAASRTAHLLVLRDSRIQAAPGRPGQQVAVLLVMRARCPIIMVPRSGEPARDETAARRRMAEHPSIVVGVDGTHAGRGGLELAFTQASSRGAQLKVVHVWPPQNSGPRVA